MEISEKIKQVRESFSLNQKDFAERLGITQAAISRYEKKERIPDIDFLDSLIKNFKINPLWLLSDFSNIQMLQDDDLCIKALELAILNNREEDFKKLLVNFIGQQNTILVVSQKIEKLIGQTLLEKLSADLSGKGERMLRVLHDFLIYLQKQNICFSPQLKVDFINSLKNYNLSKEFKTKYLYTTGTKDKENLIRWAEKELDDASIFEIMTALPELTKEVEKKMNIFDRFLIKILNQSY